MATFNELCTDNLETALESDDPSVKDFHIRQVLQACSPDYVTDSFERV